MCSSSCPVYRLILPATNSFSSAFPSTMICCIVCPLLSTARRPQLFSDPLCISYLFVVFFCCPSVHFLCEYWCIPKRLSIVFHTLTDYTSPPLYCSLNIFSCFSRSYCYILVWSRLLASSRRPSVRLSVCNAVHCGSQGRCSGLKVIPACS